MYLQALKRAGVPESEFRPEPAEVIPPTDLRLIGLEGEVPPYLAFHVSIAREMIDRAILHYNCNDPAEVVKDSDAATARALAVVPGEHLVSQPLYPGRYQLVHHCGRYAILRDELDIFGTARVGAMYSAHYYTQERLGLVFQDLEWEYQRRMLQTEGIRSAAIERITEIQEMCLRRIRFALRRL